jgi:hypothetical protein
VPSDCGVHREEGGIERSVSGMDETSPSERVERLGRRLLIVGGYTPRSPLRMCCYEVADAAHGWPIVLSGFV